MLEIGQYNRLQVIKEVDFGYYLDSGDEQWGEILLPFGSAPKACEIYDWLEVFIYFDSEDRIIATTRRPHAVVGEFNLLRVASVEPVGAFLDWGLQKDLLVPFGEQKVRLKAGRSYIVRVFRDDTSGRIVASTRLDKFLGKEPGDYRPGQAVELLITRETELGHKAIINSSHWGFLFRNEVFRKLRVGQKLKGYIKQARDDGKIDLTLAATGYEKVGGIAETILRQLAQRNGFLPITAKTSAQEISSLFGVSKKNFKMAIGALYKKRLVTIEADGIRLVKPTEPDPVQSTHF
jgi:predicted RNA-binding protein (virulence factor B family)